MRISDWSSDVCSSDLAFYNSHVHHRQTAIRRQRGNARSKDMADTATLPPPEHLKSARIMAEAHPTRWPGESADYRRARTDLLAEEIELRRHIQRVAEHRRALPPGPEAKDYRFLDAEGRDRSAEKTSELQ